MVTTDQLRGWRPDLLSETAGALGRDAAGLDVLAERLGSITGPQLQQAWEGYAATEATALGAARQTEIVTYAAQVTTARQILAAAATQITQAQAQLRRAEATAADARLTVAPDGIATPLPEPPVPGLVPTEQLAVTARREEEARAVTLMTRAALTTAEEADRDAARALRNLPEMTTLFTAAGAALFPLLAGAGLRALLAAGLVRGVMLRDLPPSGATPQQAAAWWAGLTPQQRQLQIRANPDRIGAMNGLPAVARDAANRIVLKRELGQADADINRLQSEIRTLEAQVAQEYEGMPPTSHLGATATLTRLTELRGRLAERTRYRDMLTMVDSQLEDRPDRTLLLLDTTGEPRASIGIGPVDTAEHVAVVVPGLEQDVREEMGSIVWNADRLFLTADALDTRGEGVATIAWLGYDTPSFAEVPSPARAKDGAEHLLSTLQGLEAAREAARSVPTGDGPAPLHLTVVGHSYGSLTSGLALQEANPVDDVAFIGSPGVGAQHVSELQIPEGHVFVGEARGDAVADLAHFGIDPSNDQFGAREFDTGEGAAALDDSSITLKEVTGHSQYFDETTSSVYNLAYITLGRGDLISPGVSDGIGDRIAQILDWTDPWM